MELKKYITYEEPLEGKSFTINQLHEVYRDLVDKEEYCGIRGYIKRTEFPATDFGSFVPRFAEKQ